MRLRSGGAHTIAATGAVYVRFGGASVTAANTDHYFPQGLYYDFAVSGGDVGKGPQNTHVAVLAAGSNCTVYISEKE